MSFASGALELARFMIHYEGSRDPPGATSLWTDTLCFAGRGLVDVDAGLGASRGSPTHGYAATLRGRDGGIRKKLAAGIKLKNFAARSSRVPVAERFPASNMEN